MYHIVILETLVCSEHSYSTTLNLVGRQIWRGALLLADFVLHHGPSLLQGRTVLELASGVGLTSIVAAMFATEVICTGDMNFIVFLYTASWHHLHVYIYIYIYIYLFIFSKYILLTWSVKMYAVPTEFTTFDAITPVHVNVCYRPCFNILNLARPAIAWQMVKLYF